MSDLSPSVSSSSSQMQEHVQNCKKISSRSATSGGLPWRESILIDRRIKWKPCAHKQIWFIPSFFRRPLVPPFCLPVHHEATSSGIMESRSASRAFRHWESCQGVSPVGTSLEGLGSSSAKVPTPEKLNDLRKDNEIYESMRRK